MALRGVGWEPGLLGFRSLCFSLCFSAGFLGCLAGCGFAPSLGQLGKSSLFSFSFFSFSPSASFSFFGAAGVSSSRFQFLMRILAEATTSSSEQCLRTELTATPMRVVCSSWMVMV